MMENLNHLKHKKELEERENDIEKMKFNNKVKEDEMFD
jgi:hypothetical protein